MIMLGFDIVLSTIHARKTTQIQTIKTHIIIDRYIFLRSISILMQDGNSLESAKSKCKLQKNQLDLCVCLCQRVQLTDGNTFGSYIPIDTDQEVTT